MGSLSTEAWLLCTTLGFILLPSLPESCSPPRTKNQQLKHSCWNAAPAPAWSAGFTCHPRSGYHKQSYRSPWLDSPSQLLLSVCRSQHPLNLEFFSGHHPSTLFQLICPPSGLFGDRVRLREEEIRLRLVWTEAKVGRDGLTDWGHVEMDKDRETESLILRNMHRDGVQAWIL